MTGPLGPAMVESKILYLSERLEEQTDEYALRAEAAARAQITYKVAHSKAMLSISAANIPEREAKALLQTEEQALAYEVADAVAKAALETCRSLRQQLSAWQSVGATIRSQMELGRTA